MKMMEAINASGNRGGSLQIKRLEWMHIEYIVTRSRRIT